MLCIKKNKCFVLRKINAFQLCCYYRKKNRQHTVIRSDLLKPVETRFNPFRSVQTRSNLLKHVTIRSNTFPLPPPPPPFPLSFWGGGRGREGGKPPPPKPPGRGGSLETGLDRSERIETCFDRFQQV